jgi:hypothetical protein
MILVIRSGGLTMRDRVAARWNTILQKLVESTRHGLS